MSTKIYDEARSASLALLTDAGGASYILKPNGKKHYYLETAITENVTADDAVASAPVAGDTAETSHATGLSSTFVSDGTKWQLVHTAAGMPIVADGDIFYALKPNGKKHYFLETAITADTTLDDAVATAPVAGDTAETSHATGLSSIFVSDGAKWQFLTNA